MLISNVGAGMEREYDPKAESLHLSWQRAISGYSSQLDASLEKQ
jgi:hypothetical protein